MLGRGEKRIAFSQLSTRVAAAEAQRFISDTVSIGFLGLAAGSILYVVIELLAVARNRDATCYGGTRATRAEPSRAAVSDPALIFRVGQ